MDARKLIQHPPADLMEEIGDMHLGAGHETPLRADAFALDDETKINTIAHHFREIMTVLGLDIHDDSLRGTPHRVAKMYVKEIFSGLNPINKPAISLFDNHYRYGEMVVEKNITVYSYCEHHFVPIIGKAHVAYIPGNNVIGLSKLNRLVQYYSKRPQVQERLTEQIAESLRTSLSTADVAVVIEATHLCVASRGVHDVNSSTVTSHFSGKFRDDAVRKDLLHYLK